MKEKPRKKTIIASLDSVPSQMVLLVGQHATFDSQSGSYH